ncbi:MAG: mechanosensitive ion channel family protein [Candidatus Peribacteraceae bacterium]|jgi:small-conductance mechanosensitive channel|nr:mechanosensitive ion channel family protein [Candidatus Peribacteraceae bacterium]
MPEIQQILEYQILENTVAQLGTAAAVFIAIFIALRVFRKHVIGNMVKMAGKTNTKVDDVVSGFLNSIKMPIYLLIAMFVALQGIHVPESLNLVVDVLILVIIVSQVIKLIEEVFCMVLSAQLQKTNKDAVIPGIFRMAVRMVLWSIGFLLILSNAGVDITSLVAGLGIGGLAISLALQNILSDLFASFSIAIDKPFEIGDFIIVGEHKGTVKHIGMKTTRITALQGEEVVISNAELTTTRVQNYKKMQKRRIVFTFGCTYGAKADQMKKVSADVAKIIDDHDFAEVDRVHFNNFGDSDLQFEAVYYMTTSDYVKYMDTQQDINIQLMKYFEENNLEMAYPTQTLYVKKEE